MNIGPETRVFISVSATPGRFGATVYNTLFQRLGIDAVYLPRPAPPKPEQVVEAVRTLDLAGCSVSSPHKSGILPFLDALEPEAERANAVNTIYRDADRLTGACTDADGVAGALADLRPMPAIVHGSGGVAGPAVIGLQRLGFRDITIVARNAGARKQLAERFNVAHADDARADLVVNATPAGRDTLSTPMLVEMVSHARVFLDMPVASRDTAIVAHARARGVDCRTGVDMCTHQIASQARRYLGRAIDVATVRDIVVREYLREA